MRKLKIGEYAKLVGLSQSYVRLLEERGKIHPIRMPSGYRYYDEKALQEAVSLSLISQEEVNKVIQKRS